MAAKTYFTLKVQRKAVCFQIGILFSITSPESSKRSCINCLAIGSHTRILKTCCFIALLLLSSSLFSMHEALYHYKRLNYGTSSAAEVFQNILLQNLSLQKQIKFHGLIFTEKGTRTEAKNVKHPLNNVPPQKASEVPSFLGMANTCSDYIQNYATLGQQL